MVLSICPNLRPGHDSDPSSFDAIVRDLLMSLPEPVGPGLRPEHDSSGIKLITMQFTTLCYDWQDCNRIGG